ncbi:MAG TPA: AarF/ABC1/UbiB kinase family protein, partial [Micromonospora sp.]
TPTEQIDAEAVLNFLLPMLEPITVDEFRFTRAWLRGEAARLASPRSPAYQLSRQLNLPPSYMLIHRVTLGSIGVLCQLEAKAPYRSIMERWLPGLAPVP